MSQRYFQKLEKRKKIKKMEKEQQNKTQHQWEEAPDSYLGFDFLKLAVNTPQSEEWRNIWEKSWRTWKYVGTHHLEDADWFLKLDDDTFLSPINFKGFARYFNPNRKWYLGNTLLHKWKGHNIVFNAGACYAISRGALRELMPVFESDTFLNRTVGKHQTKWAFCMDRDGPYEDPTMGVCLRSIGINPTNTLDEQYRERFSIFREGYHHKLSRKRSSDLWYWKWKPLELKDGRDCCSKHMISFHGYKHSQVGHLESLHERYNVEEGVDGKKFDVPSSPKMFLHQELDFEVDQWMNSQSSFARGQLMYQGPFREKLCWKCNETVDR